MAWHTGGTKRGAAAATPRGIAYTAPVWAVVPDAYADVPGAVIDVPANALQAVAALVKATVFGVTFRLLGTLNGTDWTPLTTQNELGVNRAIDVPVAATASAELLVTGATPAGLAGLVYKGYKVQAKNTVGASVGTATVSLFAR